MKEVLIKHTSLTAKEVLYLSLLTVTCCGIVTHSLRGDVEPVLVSVAFSGIAFAFTYSLIRWLGKAFMKAGLKGRDMSKLRKEEMCVQGLPLLPLTPAQMGHNFVLWKSNAKRRFGDTKSPETMGAVCAVVYILTVIVFIPFPFYKDIVAATSGGGNRDVMLERQDLETGRTLHLFPHSKLASYLSAILSLQSVVLLGIGDDLFDIRWRHKFFIPAFAAIPMLVVYFVDFGVTNVVVPVQLESYLGQMVDLGWLYYAYMAAIAIFCPNSINILAGINGIEVSQSLVISLLLLINDILSLYAARSGPDPHPATDPHLFSIYLLLPFTGVSLALWWHNWYPAKVFVGDTYCYFAGMVFAIVGILGHFSKTLLLLFIPQILNFLYSSPQLFRVIPCPRHRLPRFNPRSGLLEPSVTSWQHPPSRFVTWVLKFLTSLSLPLIQVKTSETGQIVESTNLTILNLWLVWFGPMREDRLAIEILALQMLIGCLGLFVRHELALWVFRQDNR